MKNQYLGIAIILVALVGTLRCASMSDVMKAKSEGKGTTRDYPVTANQAWEIARTIFRWEGAGAIEEHRTEGYMLTSSGPDFVSYGAFMGAWIEPINENNTRVTVVTNIATTLTETTFHRRFAQAVEIVKAENPLPLVPPELED